jgi:hypothetical protein
LKISIQGEFYTVLYLRFDKFLHKPALVHSKETWNPKKAVAVPEHFFGGLSPLVALLSKADAEAPKKLLGQTDAQRGDVSIWDNPETKLPKMDIHGISSPTRRKI